ncbi:hypothetical protein CKM354_001150300 [Cercospora kikuchii]|uniref:Uncharacterized protein n=1 Tax=Cercospora kikuchii TaxID=84275 RepID=A0A9P3CT41_9PEZI|nr:uncharacterized protein CKM354_001150300 [Cercospora kikuchii]GIZ48443.1 hypothetical protein CKM354_001150300 [Cercospora kikuchii]
MPFSKKIEFLLMLARRALHGTLPLRQSSSKRFAVAPSPHRSDLVTNALGQDKGRYGREEFFFDLKNFNIGLLLGLVGAKGLNVAMKEEVEWTWK